MSLRLCGVGPRCWLRSLTYPLRRTAAGSTPPSARPPPTAPMAAPLPKPRPWPCR